jgi:PIN domain nuclease of toxin-antitoxin system
VSTPAAFVVDALRSALGLTVCDASFVAVAHAAEGLDWTRDPFDGLIVAQAGIHEAPLVTKDGALHARYERCVW